MKILLTGAAGFIGFHLAQQLLQLGHHVEGIDNLNDYYDVQLKKDRLQQLSRHESFNFHHQDIACQSELFDLMKNAAIEIIINLAAQAGVRYSISHPESYIQTNLVGFANILEAARQFKIKHLIFASSSSVYGANSSTPFKESQHTDHPVSLYGATKKSNEMMAHSYASLFNIPMTGLRFFTVYGPWGRPDMAYFKFTKNILAGNAIDVYNHGNMQRDFTYIDDIVSGIIGCLNHSARPANYFDKANPNPAISYAPYRIYNIGNTKTVKLMDFIQAIEKACDKKAILNHLPMQAGDVLATHADVSLLQSLCDYHPTTDIEQGVLHFVKWYRNYYGK